MAQDRERRKLPTYEQMTGPLNAQAPALPDFKAPPSSKKAKARKSKKNSVPRPAQPAFRTQDAVVGGLGLLVSQALGGKQAAQAFGQGYLAGKRRKADAETRHELLGWQAKHQKSLQKGKRVPAKAPVKPKAAAPSRERDGAEGFLPTVVSPVQAKKAPATSARLPSRLEGLRKETEGVETKLADLEKRGVTFGKSDSLTAADGMVYLLRRYKEGLLAEAKGMKDRSPGSGNALVVSELKRVDALLGRARKRGGTDGMLRLHEKFRQEMEKRPADAAKLRSAWKQVTKIKF